MTKVSGASAYQRLQVPKDNLSQSAQYWGGLDAHRKNLEDARREKRKEEQRKEFNKKYDIKVEDYQLDDTEFRNVNVVGREAISQIRDRLYEVKQKLVEDPNNLELQKQWDSLNLSASTLKEGHNKFLEMGQQYLAMVEKGEISGLDERDWQERLEAYDEGRIKIRIDEKGSIHYDIFDKEGQFMEEIEYKDLVNGTLRSKVDIPSQITSTLKSIGAIKYDSNIGGFVKSVDEWGEKQEAQADRLANIMLEDEDVLDDILYQAGMVDESDHFDKETKKRVATQYMKELLRGAYKETTELDPYNRPLPRTQNQGWGQQKDQLKANNLYDVSMRLASREKGALDQVVGLRLKVQDGDKTVEKIVDSYNVLEDGSVVLLDPNGNEIQTVDSDSNKRREALKWAMIVQNGQSSDEVQTYFEMGEMQSGGQYTVGETAGRKTREEVSVYDLSAIDNIDDEEDMVTSLRRVLSDDEWKVTSPVDITQEKIQLIAPNGQTRQFKTSQKQQIKDFIKQNGKRKSEFKDVEPKKQTTSNVEQGSIDELPD